MTEHYRSASYEASYMGDCAYDSEAEPCWGQVEVVDYEDHGDFGGPVIACEGHVDANTGGAYRPEGASL